MPTLESSSNRSSILPWIIEALLILDLKLFFSPGTLRVRAAS